MSKSDKKEKYIFSIFLVACFIFYFFWSIAKGFNFGPDEYMRYDLPLYIYDHGVLPDGFVEEIRNKQWGFSYAFFPTFLGPLLSTFFMKIVSIFTADPFVLVIAARFTSVIFGTLTVYFTYKIGEKMFSNEYKWFMMIFVAMMPQFAFLTSYVNNDIICVGGTAIVLYSWICGLSEQWNYKNMIMLAIGIVICALSYYNSYGWILLSIVLFPLSFVLRVNDNKGQKYKEMFVKGGIICLIVLAFISYFYVRNAVLYNGDFLGMKSMAEASEMYAIDTLKPSLRNTPEHMGVSLRYMLFDMGWLKGTYKSFIGVFGYMNVFCPNQIYVFYMVIILLAFIGIVFAFIKLIVLKKRVDRLKCIMHTAMIIGIIIVVSLVIYSSYFGDFQAQGRYCYPMFIAFAYFMAYGFSNLPVPEKFTVLKCRVVNILCILMVIICIYTYMGVFLPA